MQQQQYTEDIDEEGEEVDDFLDKGMSLIRRKTLGISANNVGDAFMKNFEDVNKVVEDYNKQSEDAF